MNNQEAFDKVIDHLDSMTHQSADSEGHCYYRSPDGGMCAVGCLIPDELYSIEMENSMAFVALKGIPLFANVDLEMLTDLQTIHDTPSFWGQYGLSWEQANKRVAAICDKYNVKRKNNNG